MSEDQNQAQPQEKDTVLKAGFACSKCGYDDIDLNKPLGFCPDCGAALKPMMQNKDQVVVKDMSAAMGSRHIAAIPKEKIPDRYRQCPKCKMGYDHKTENRCPSCDTLDTVYDNVELKGLDAIRKEHNQDLDREAKGE